MNRKKCNNQEEEYRSEVRLWTRIALTATALSPQKKGNREPVKAEKSEKGMTKQPGSTQGSVSEETAFAPPLGLYPDLHSVRPPPYAPKQDLQQVQVMVKDGMVEVEIDANCSGPEDSGPREGGWRAWGTARCGRADILPPTRNTTEERWSFFKPTTRTSGTLYECRLCIWCRYCSNI